MPIDILVLLIFDFDVVLEMNWLNKYQVIIECAKLELRMEVRGQ